MAAHGRSVLVCWLKIHILLTRRILKETFWSQHVLLCFCKRKSLELRIRFRIPVDKNVSVSFNVPQKWEKFRSNIFCLAIYVMTSSWTQHHWSPWHHRCEMQSHTRCIKTVRGFIHNVINSKNALVPLYLFCSYAQLCSLCLTKFPPAHSGSEASRDRVVGLFITLFNV